MVALLQSGSGTSLALGVLASVSLSIPPWSCVLGLGFPSVRVRLILSAGPGLLLLHSSCALDPSLAGVVHHGASSRVGLVHALLWGKEERRKMPAALWLSRFQPGSEKLSGFSRWLGW